MASEDEVTISFGNIPALSINGDISSAIIPDDIDYNLTSSECRIIATVKGNALTDGVSPFTASTTVENAVLNYRGQPYLQRHFEFSPGGTNPTSAQISLYVSKAEMIAFNAASTVKLPVEMTDAKSELRIWQWHGATVSGEPDVTIDPDDDNIQWDEAIGAWKIRFAVTGFSSFYITADNAVPLPVTLISFSAQKQENTVALNWQTTEETNSDYFEIQHSTNGKQWNPIGKVASAGESKILRHYTYIHSNPVPGENLYRMKMVDQDATFTMSGIVLVVMESAGSLSVFPNPATVTVIATSTTPISSYQLLTTKGRVVSERSKVGIMRLELSDLPVTSGLYILKITFDNGRTEHRKLFIK